MQFSEQFEPIAWVFPAGYLTPCSVLPLEIRSLRGEAGNLVISPEICRYERITSFAFGFATRISICCSLLVLQTDGMPTCPLSLSHTSTVRFTLARECIFLDTSRYVHLVQLVFVKQSIIVKLAYLIRQAALFIKDIQVFL